MISLYARGLPVRETQGHLTELYGREVSPDLIATIRIYLLDTDYAVIDCTWKGSIYATEVSRGSLFSRPRPFVFVFSAIPIEH